MIAIALAGCLSFWVMVAGLVVGEGMLRVGGLGGLLLCAALAVALDVYATRFPKPLLELDLEDEGWADELHDETFNDWPGRAA